MPKYNTINVQDASIRMYTEQLGDYVSLTDIAKQSDNERSDQVIYNWIRTRNTIEFLGVWEQVHNHNFNPLEFEGIRNQAGVPSFVLTVKRWVERTAAIGILSKAGRYGGTYAHQDIALEFCTWISPRFKVYFIKEFQRLKKESAAQQKEQLQWSVRRELSKINYHLHTDAVKLFLPPKLDEHGRRFMYSNEADLLNLALFGITAQEWRKQNTDKKGNMRDHASIEQLTVLANLENLNAYLIKSGLEADERLVLLNEEAINQMNTLLKYSSTDNLKRLDS